MKPPGANFTENTMCGRFSLAVDGDFLASLFGLLEVPIWTPRYNVAPTQPVLTIQDQGAGRLPRMARWGLIPSWTRDPSESPLMINARSESAREKPSFRTRVKKGRCLIPADGFFEWKALAGPKQPYWFSFGGNQPFAFAGLWDVWNPPGGDPIVSCAILTTQAKGWMVQYHERMPVILKESDYGLWLDSHEVPPTDWDRITTAFGAEPMKARPVSTRVNRADWDGPQCIEESTVSLSPPEPKKEPKRKARPSPPPPGKGLFDP